MDGVQPRDVVGRQAHGLFAVIRLALHEGRFDDASRSWIATARAPPPSAGVPPGRSPSTATPRTCGPSPATPGRPRARLEPPIASTRSGRARRQRLWAAPCLLRAEGRLTGDDDLLARAAEDFGVIGARFEQAVTESLLSGGRAERGRQALRELGCAPEQRP